MISQAKPHGILAVDDEPDLELLISFMGNGAEALDKIQANRNLDVMRTDITMPVMDGLTLLSRLRDAHPQLRAAIVSAYGDTSNIRTALNRGAFDFVTKPIDFQDLEITLDNAIGESVPCKQAAKDRGHLLSINRELDLAAASLPPLAMFPAKESPMPQRSRLRTNVWKI